MAAASPAAEGIVGREAELDRLRTLLGADDRPLAVFIEGDAGVGKTALLVSEATRAAAAGTRVLWARPTESETAGSFAALVDLLRPVVDELAVLPEPQRRALAAAMWLEVAQAPIDPHLVGLACLSLLGGMDGSVLIAIDDWQWLDAPSAAALSFVLRRLEPGGPKLVATVRRGEADARLARLLGSLPPAQAVELSLGPLDSASLQRLVHARTGSWLAPPELERLHAACGGNPLLALELVRAPDSTTASDIRRLLAVRVAALSPGTRKLLRFVAASSAPTSDLLELAMDRADGAAHALEQAFAADVLVGGGRLRFTHPLLAEVVAQRTPPLEWREVHRRLAELVENPEARCRHLAAAASGPDARVASMLEVAAEEARGRGALVATAELAEFAVELTPDTDAAVRGRRALLAADAHDRSGDGRRASALLEDLVTRAPPGPVRAGALYRLAYIGDYATGTELATRALAEAGDDGALLAHIHICLVGMTALSGDSAAAMRHAELGMRHAERAGDPAGLVEALENFAYMRWVTQGGVQRDDLARVIELERRTGLSPRDGSGAEFLAMQLIVAGELAEARGLLEPDLEREVARGDLQHEAQALRLLVDVELRAGRWRRADAYADRALEVTLGCERWNAEGCGRWVRAVVDAHLGRVERAREHAQAGLAVSRELDDLAWSVCCSHVLGFLELSEGDATAAVAHLAPLPAHEQRLGAAEPARFGFAPDLAEALVLTGDLDAARGVERDLSQRGNTLGRRWAIATGLRCRGLIAAADGELDAALAALEEAIAVHEQVPQPFDRARTLLALGATQRRAKHRAEARASLEAAFAVFEELGAPLWGQRARSEIARLGGRRVQDRDELTEAERRIAELAASGRSNREIAGELFLSERTVESNLTRAYRKLGVRSRTELARRLPTA